MSQLSLGALLAGRREGVSLPPKRPVGRPRKRSAEGEFIEVEGVGPQVEVRSGDVRRAEPPEVQRFRLRVDDDKCLREFHEVLELTGDSVEAFEAIPGSRPVRDESFGLQAKVRFIEWFRRREDLVGTERLLSQCVRQMDRPMSVLVRALRQEEELRAALTKRGLTASGLSMADAQKPAVLRAASRRSKGVALRKAGAGRRAAVSFLYPLVREYFLEARERGLLVFPQDLRRRLLMTLRAYEAGAAELEQAGRELSAGERLRLGSVKERLEREAQPTRSSLSHTHFELMRVCGAVLRKPQRLVPLTLEQERERAVASWRGFDHVLWLSLGGEAAALEDRVAKPADFLARLEDTAILMSDQVPFWVKIGRERALYHEAELCPRRRTPQEQRGAEMTERWKQSDVLVLPEDRDTTMTREREHSLSRDL